MFVDEPRETTAKEFGYGDVEHFLKYTRKAMSEVILLTSVWHVSAVSVAFIELLNRGSI